MLAADKLQLQSALKQQATALKEKEFNLHHSNLMTVGTQAAVLAGLDITMFIEFTPSPIDEWSEEYRLIGCALKIMYYTVIVAAFCSNMIVVSQTTILSVLGAGLALRGPDGSMMIATDALYEERKFVFTVFAIGLACTVGSVLVSVWLMLNVEAASLCFLVAVVTCSIIYTNFQRISTKLEYDESLTVDFREFMEQGPSYFIQQQQQRSDNNHFGRTSRKNSNASISSSNKNNNNNNNNYNNKDIERRSLLNGGRTNTATIKKYPSQLSIGQQSADYSANNDNNSIHDDDGIIMSDESDVTGNTDDIEMYQRYNNQNSNSRRRTNRGIGVQRSNSDVIVDSHGKRYQIQTV